MAEWEKVSSAAKGWDAVSVPLDAAKAKGFGGFSKFDPVDPQVLEERKLAAKKLAEEREAERKRLDEEKKIEEAKQEAIKAEEKKKADKKISQDRRDKRNAARLSTLQRGFMIDQFTDTCSRMVKAARPVAIIALTTCLLVLGAGLTWKVLAMDFNCKATPTVPDRKNGQDGGDKPDSKKPKVVPDGDGTPDDPDPSKWGWDKYFSGDGKKKLTP